MYNILAFHVADEVIALVGLARAARLNGCIKCQDLERILWILIRKDRLENYRHTSFSSSSLCRQS